MNGDCAARLANGSEWGPRAVTLNFSRGREGNCPKLQIVAENKSSLNLSCQ